MSGRVDVTDEARGHRPLSSAAYRKDHPTPLAPEIAESNRSLTERLRTLAQRLAPAMLAMRLPNGWTVAIALAHIAFWDRQRMCLMQRWGAGDWCNGGYDGELFNDVLRPFLELIPGERAASVAIDAAEKADAVLLAASDDLIHAALARPDKPNLDRGAHRSHHLDQIEQALAEALSAGQRNDCRGR